MTWRRRIEPLTRPVFFAVSRLARGRTLGVRGVVTDAQGRVLLVEHTYVHGWYLPGGGVERGETAEQALARELVEEAGVRSLARPRLLSVHSNERYFRGDHVLVYRVTAWEPCAASSRGEIAAARFFSRDALPPETTAATRRRIDEALDDRDPDPAW